MATTPNIGLTVIDSSPEKAHDLIPQLRDLQFEIDAAMSIGVGSFSVLAFGARGDAIEIVDAAMTAASDILTSSGSTFTIADIGKLISVRGTSITGAIQRGTILDVPSPTTLQVSFDAEVTAPGEQAVYGTDDRAAFIAAIAAAIAEGGGTVIVPASFYYLAGNLPVAGLCAIKGSGWNEKATEGVASIGGSILYVGFDVATADSLFYVTAQGVEIQDLEFYATQKEPTPITTPWGIFAYRNPAGLPGGDGLKARRLMIRNLSHGIKITADRPSLDGIYGQPMVRGIYIDGCYDAPKINDIHWFPFWNNTATGYTLATRIGLLLGRVDGPSISNYFTYGCHRGIDFEESAVGIAPSGSTSRAQFSNIFLDNVHYGIYAGGNFDAVFTNLQVFCASGMGDGTTGSRGIWIRSTSSGSLQITGGDFTGSDLEAIRVDAGFVGWSSVWVRTWNLLNNGSTAFYFASGALANPGATLAQASTGNGALAYGGAGTPVGLIRAAEANGNNGIGTLNSLNKLQIKGSVIGAETTPDWQLRLSKNFATTNGLGAGPGILLAHQADNPFSGVADGSNLKRAAISAPAEDAAFSKKVGLGFWTSDTDAAMSEKMRLTGAGLLNISALTASKAVFTDASKNLSSTGTLGVDQGGTGTVTPFTAGSVIFAGASGVYAQDNANLFYNDSTNVLGIGTAAPSVRLGQKLDISSVTLHGGMNLSTWAGALADASSILDLSKSRGGSTGAHGLVADGDRLGYIAFRGSDGAAFRDAAYIAANIDGTPGASDMPGRLAFFTTPDGSVTATERMRISSAGVVSITGSLTVSTSISTPSLIAAANLTAAPVGDWIFNAGGKDILPSVNYDQNLGALDKKYLTLHAAELRVETLVASETMATFGGRGLFTPCTLLTADLAPATTTITVKHNNLVNGDRIYLETVGQVEFMAVTSSAGGSAGAYTYTVTRNLDGSGANQWYAGDSIATTAMFIDVYSTRGVKAGTEVGPTIAGNVRNSTTYNDWSTHWAIGNLDGLYGYSGTAFGAAFGKFSTTSSYVTIDATNGYRAISQNAVRLQISAAGVLTLNDSTGTAKITLDASAGMTLDGKMQMLGSNSAISIGVIPPLSSAIGTGLWEDRTGLYGILGVSQVETTLVVGPVTGSGNAAVTVTAAAMTGSPYVLNVAVLNGDTATNVATKVRAALDADAAFRAFFNATGGTGANVIMTAIHGRANDATMNLRITNGTCTGLTLADSANTTAGSNTTQIKIDAALGVLTAGSVTVSATGILAGGTVGLNALGLQVVGATNATFSQGRAITNVAAIDGAVWSAFYDFNDAAESGHQTILRSNAIASRESILAISCDAPTGKSSTIDLGVLVNSLPVTDLAVDETGIHLSAGTGMALRLRIDNYVYIPDTTRLGIGIASPNRQFHVHSTANTTFQITDGTTGSGAGDGFQFQQAGTTTWLINQENGPMKFRTNDTDHVTLSAAGLMRFHVYGAGTATFDASGNITSVSDERMKHLQGDFKVGLNELLKVKPILYKWNEESGNETEHVYAGFSAQNVRESIGEFGVGTNGKGMLSLQDRAITAASVNAIKELNSKVRDLEKQIEDMRKGKTK